MYLLLGSHQYCAVQLRVIGRLTEPLNRTRVSQPPCDACQRIECFTWVLCRKKKQEDDIHRLAVDCVKVDGVLETNQIAELLLQIRYPTMSDRHPAALAGDSPV